MSGGRTALKYLSFLLVLVLSGPAAIKVTHHWFVHHEHHHLEDPGHSAIHKPHQLCPICNFHFVEFFSNPEPELPGQAVMLADQVFAFVPGEYLPADLYGYPLRGPPAGC